MLNYSFKQALFTLGVILALVGITYGWDDDWSVGGTIPDYRYQNAPVVAALDPASPAKSVILWGGQNIRVRNADGSEDYTITIDEEDYNFEFAPAVGNVVGDEVPEIVAVASKWSLPYKYGSIYVFDGVTGEELDYFEIEPLMSPGIPVLADIESDIEGSFEDGNFEILIGNRQVGNGDFILGSYDVVLNGETVEIQEIKRKMIENNAGVPIDNRAPAVADFNGDGKKEVVFATNRKVWWWTYDQSNADRFTSEHSTDQYGFGFVAGQFYGIYGCVGPIIADIENDGKLWVIVPLTRHPTQDNYGKGKLIVLDITGNDWAGVEHPAYDAAVLPDQQGELFPFGVGTEDDMGAVGDFGRRNNYNPNGMLSIAMDMGTPTLIGSHVDPGNPDYKQIFIIAGNEVGYWMGIGKMGNINDLDYRLCLNYNTARTAKAFSIEEGQNNQPEYSGQLQGDHSGFGGAVITDIDSDGDIDLLYRSLDDADGGTTNIYVIETAATYETTERELIEWSQLQNGPRHQGLYAQPYQTTLPLGHTYFRDRVIIIDGVDVAGYWLYVQGSGLPGGTRELTIEDNTVVEFNDGAYLNGNDGSKFHMGENVVLKPNSGDEDNWYIRLYGRVTVDWEDVDFRNGRVIIEPDSANPTATFTDCHFVGDGSYTAIDAEDTDLEFINCTFDNYATAVSMDGGTAVIQGCTFTDMTGTVLDIANCTTTNAVTIEGCTITESNGMAIYSYNSRLTLEDNIITDNGGTIAAVYAYNSYITMIGNDISDNLRVGLKVAGGGSTSMTNWSSSYANRISENQQYTHTPKVDSTWAEMIQVSPSRIYWADGHNDIINNGGDYLVASHSFYLYQYPMDGTDNYYDVYSTLNPADFKPTSSIIYLPKDSSPNYTSGVEEEELAMSAFITAKQAADSGNFQDAVQSFLGVIDEYPETSVAPTALRMVYDIAEQAGLSAAQLNQQLTGIINDNSGTDVAKYAFRLANLQNVENGDYDNAIDNLDDAMENADTFLDSMYYAADQAYAVLARLKAAEDEVGSVRRNDDKAAVESQKKYINRLMAMLNGVPYENESENAAPGVFGLVAAYPNPFNSTTTIRFNLQNTGYLKSAVYDVNGREVAVLHDGAANQGAQSLAWNAIDVPSGVYFCRLESAGKVNTLKMTLMR